MIEQPQEPVVPAAAPQEAPPPVLPFKPGAKRVLDADGLKAWQKRVERAEAKAKVFHPQWERALKRYAEAKVDERKTEINALIDYRHVESKKAQLFHRTPEINLLPVDPQDQVIPYDTILPLREKFLNHELGPDGANAKRAIHKTLIDTLAASGWMAVEVGYEVITLPDPVTQVPVPVYAKRFVEAISSKRLLVPDDFYDTDFDKAPWLGYRGRIALSKAKKLGWTLPEGFEGTRSAHDARFKHDVGDEEASDPQADYIKLWIRAAEFDETVFHPELYRCLILVDGCNDEPAWYVDSPFQTLNPDGTLSDDSMIGNPIHMDAIRDLIDSAYVPSDLVVGEQLSQEINKFRTELMLNRKSRRPKEFISAALGQETIQKVLTNEGPVTVPEDQIIDGKMRGFAVEQGGTEPRDNFTAQEKAEQDWEGALGSGTNQAGNFDRTKRTATEVRTVQGNSAARAETDKDRVREYVVRLVRKFDAIVQRTATPQEVLKVLGQSGAGLYEQWRALPGKYAYKIQPDSGQYIDAKEYRAMWLQLYELVRKDPLANAAEVLRGLFRSFSMDAGKMVPQEQTKEKPDQPKVSISFNAEQALMNPAEMQLLLMMLEQSGYEIPPELAGALQAVATLRSAVAAEQQQTEAAQHGGPASKVERINKHQSQKTGGVQGAA